ncbi:FH protein interacting protein FIP2 [Tanacetum coccineum]
MCSCFGKERFGGKSNKGTLLYLYKVKQSQFCFLSCTEKSNSDFDKVCAYASWTYESPATAIDCKTPIEVRDCKTADYSKASSLLDAPRIIMFSDEESFLAEMVTCDEDHLFVVKKPDSLNPKLKRCFRKALDRPLEDAQNSYASRFQNYYGCIRIASSEEIESLHKNNTWHWCNYPEGEKLMDDLSYVDFSFACLKNVFFSRANLHCAKFRDVDAENTIFHNATLRECEFTGANLRGALLAGANLQNACLIDCSFCGADLRSAHLQTADLTNANLEGANLEGANLKGAKLTNANLKGANLQRAYLRHVNLRETDLEGAKLDGANLLGAIR